VSGFPLFSSLGILVLASACAGSATPREEAEKVMHAGLPSARRAVADGRELTPFAFVMASTGDIRRIAPTEQSPGLASEEGVDSLVRDLREGAETGHYKSIAIFVEVSIEPPAGGGKTEAVEVMLEHRDGYCVNAFFPFTRQADGAAEFAGFFAAPRPGAVFTGCND